MEHTQQLFDIAHKVLKQEGYNISTMGIGKQDTLKIEIEESKLNLDKAKMDVEKRIHNAIDAKMNVDYTIEISEESQAEIRDENWQPIFSTVMAEAHKKYNVVTGFAYSFHPKPLEIILKTSLSQGEEDKRMAEKIAIYAKEVVKVKRNKLSVDKIPYKMIIRDKNQEKLFELQVK